MSEQPSSEKLVSSPKYLSLSGLIALIAGLVFVPALLGAVGHEIGGWLGWVIFFVAWGIVFAISWVVAYRFANPILPNLCGPMVGVTVPRPSSEWLREIAGAGWGKAIDIGITMIAVAFGLTIFIAIAKRHKASSAA